MKISQSYVRKLAEDKISVEKNEFYIKLQEDILKQLKTVQESLGTARTATYEDMKFEQGKIDALGWMARRPDKLMNELIKNQE